MDVIRHSNGTWITRKLSRLCFRLLLMAALAIGGCTKPPGPILRVATNIWPGYETLYLARSLGYFDGMPIRLVEMPSSTQVSANLRDGTIEAGCLTLDEALTLLQDGVDLCVILVIDMSHGADVVMARPGINNLKALRGRRVGVENTAVGAVMLDAALEAGGLNAKAIQIVPMTVDEHVAAYRAGKIDAVVTFEPMRSELLKEGARVLFDSSRAPGRIIDVLVVRAKEIPAHTIALKGLLQGHFRAIEHLASQPQDAAARMSPRLGADPLAQFKGLRLIDLAENRTLLSGIPPRLKTAVDRLAKLMLRRGLLQQPVSVERLAEPAFLPENRP